MKQNKILSSRFFILGNESLPKERLELYCKIWWHIQPEFTLGLVILLGKVAEKIRDEITVGNLEAEELWKKIFKWQAPAIVDEMGLGRDPYGLMHHDLFIDQVCATTELSRKELLTQPFRTETNIVLADEIRKSFSSVVSGLCMMYVVETIAPQLFATQKKIFLSAGAELVKLRHSSLHENLEQSHADEAQEYLIFLRQISSEEEINALIDNYSLLWKNFFDEVYEKLMA